MTSKPVVQSIARRRLSPASRFSRQFTPACVSVPAAAGRRRQDALVKVKYSDDPPQIVSGLKAGAIDCRGVRFREITAGAAGDDLNLMPGISQAPRDGCVRQRLSQHQRYVEESQLQRSLQIAGSNQSLA